MSYSQTDLDNVETAIRKYIAGDRVSQFRHNGREIRYAETSLQELRNIRDEIRASLTPRRSRYSQIVTDKGL
ncbi:hypothetical protein ACJJJB_00090 (plasmid) [Microbulbifer sp. ANSA001]|uniref:hypothetical protein n=1 Tax=Microbulbifer sp. ANSA001 TaxID=3243358 RepID=UPI00404254B6